MGLLDRLFGGRGGTAAPQRIEVTIEKNCVAAPISGERVALADSPDPVFASGAMGPGLSIKPEGEVVFSPVTGQVVTVAETLHAIGLISDDGVEVLVHVGIDTVEMGGDGFRAFVCAGQRVEAGDPLVTFSKEKIASAGKRDDVFVIVTNSDSFPTVSVFDKGTVSAGETVISA